MKLTRTDLIILAVLAEKPSWGWEIDRYLTGIGADLWAEYSRPHLYYCLRKLEREKLVELLPRKQGELKKLYQITSAGRKALTRQKHSAQFHYNQVYFHFDLLLGFGTQLAGKSKPLSSIIKIRREALTDELNRIQQIWQEAELKGEITVGRYAVIRHRIKFLKSELDFLKWLTKEVPDDWEALERPAGK